MLLFNLNLSLVIRTIQNSISMASRVFKERLKSNFFFFFTSTLFGFPAEMTNDLLRLYQKEHLERLLLFIRSLSFNVLYLLTAIKQGNLPIKNAFLFNVTKHFKIPILFLIWKPWTYVINTIIVS